ncbi:MAG: hypothetical protein K2K11_05310, partial [Bacteroidales bacterium]|nr:hypothetical protein [Bacteroidales bacterium]
MIFAEGGNLTEGYALPAVALSLYLVLRLHQNPQKTFAGFFIGLCFAWMLLLRMNDAVMLPGGLFAGFFLYGLIQKRYKQTLVATLWFLAGAATLVLPFVIYFAAQNALADFWYGNFTFNYLYSKKNSHVLIGNLLVCLLLVVSCVLAVGKKKENRYLYFVFVPVAVLSFFLLGKRIFAHYFLVFLPFLSLCVSLVRNKYYLITLFCVTLGGFGGSVNYYLRYLRRDCKAAEVYAQAGRLFDKIPECEKNDIWCYNVISHLGIFPHYSLTPCNRIFYYRHLKYDNLAETEGIVSHRPKWALVDKKSSYWEDFDYIETNYDLVGKTDSTVCQ